MKKYYKISLYALAGLLALIVCFTAKKVVWAEPEQNSEEIQAPEQISEVVQEPEQKSEDIQESEEVQTPEQNPEEVQNPEQNSEEIPDAEQDQDRVQLADGVPAKHTIKYIGPDGEETEAQGYYMSELLACADEAKEVKFFSLNEPSESEVYLEVDYDTSDFDRHEYSIGFEDSETELRTANIILPRGVTFTISQIILSRHTDLNIYQGTQRCSTADDGRPGYLRVENTNKEVAIGHFNSASSFINLNIYGGNILALTNSTTFPAVGVMYDEVGSSQADFNIMVSGGEFTAQGDGNCGIRCGYGDLVVNGGRVAASSYSSHGISANNIIVRGNGFIKAETSNGQMLEDVFGLKAIDALTLVSNRKVSTPYGADYDECIMAKCTSVGETSKEYHPFTCARIQFDDAYDDGNNTILNTIVYSKPVENNYYGAGDLVAHFSDVAGADFIKIRKAGLKAYKHSATMDDGIVYLNFFVHAPQEPTVKVTVNSDYNGYTRENQRILGEVSGKALTVTDDMYFAPGFFLYRVPINPVEMADNVKAEITCSGMKTNDNYSLIQYYDELKAKLGDSNDATTRARVLLTYGKYMQKYLAGSHKEEWQIDSTLSESGSKHNVIERDDFVLNDTELKASLTKLQNYKGDIWNSSPYGFKYYSQIVASVSFESNISYRFRVIAKEGYRQTLIDELNNSMMVFESTTPGIDPQILVKSAIKEEAHDGMLLVIPNICYQNLDKAYDITVMGSDYYMNGSPLAYAARVSDPDQKRDVDYAMASLYNLFENVKSN